MMLLLIIGALLVALGLCGLGYCIRQGFVIRRDKPSPETARLALQRLVAVNLASVALAAFGLALVVVGFTLR